MFLLNYIPIIETMKNYNFSRIIPVLSLLIALLAFGYEKGYQVGDVVEDFELKNVNGKMVSMSDYSDAKGFIIVFTCNHCPYAKLYEKRIMELDQKFASKGYPVLAINPNDPVKEPEDSYEKMQEVAKEKGYSFPYLVDDTQAVARRFGATRTPHLYIVEKSNSTLVVKYIGAIDNNPKSSVAADQHYVEDALADLMKGKEVRMPETKAIGCTIKWKE